MLATKNTFNAIEYSICVLQTQIDRLTDTLKYIKPDSESYIHYQNNILYLNKSIRILNHYVERNPE